MAAGEIPLAFPKPPPTPKICLGGHGDGGTPDPIPNSEVKPAIADDTARELVGK